MATHRVHTPVAGHNGELGNVKFVDGVAEMDSHEHAAELAYAMNAGYHVEELGEPEQAVGDEPVEADVDGDGVVEELPKKSASAVVWREFAVEHGMDQEQADDLSRDQLIAYYIKETSE